MRKLQKIAKQENPKTQIRYKLYAQCNCTNKKFTLKSVRKVFCCPRCFDGKITYTIELIKPFMFVSTFLGNDVYSFIFYKDMCKKIKGKSSTYITNHSALKDIVYLKSSGYSISKL